MKMALFLAVALCSQFTVGAPLSTARVQEKLSFKIDQIEEATQQMRPEVEEALEPVLAELREELASAKSQPDLGRVEANVVQLTIALNDSLAYE